MKIALTIALLAATGGAYAKPLTADQMSLRDRVDTTFLKAGINMHVEAISNPKGSTVPKGAKLPVLLIWDRHLNRADVYQIQDKLDAIGEARKAAFGTVIFYSASGTGSMWDFDVSKPGRTCAQDLCF